MGTNPNNNKDGIHAPFYQGNGGNSFNNNQPSLRDLVLGKDRIN